jgi:SM-20-related protein
MERYYYCVLTNFLLPQTVTALLADALAMESSFTPSTVYDSGGRQSVDPRFRVSAISLEFGSQRVVFQKQLQDCLAAVTTALGITPFQLTRMELELAAHGDGAFFRRHTDGPPPQASKAGLPMRLISGVYYFNASPKGFSGGALRLYVPVPAGFIDIPPTHNSLVVFPSWLPHEVMPVSSPSSRFGDSRFAINCWYHGVPASSG